LNSTSAFIAAFSICIRPIPAPRHCQAEGFAFASESIRSRICRSRREQLPGVGPSGVERNRHLSNRRAIFTNHSSGRTARRRNLAISTSKTPRSHSDRPYRNPLFPPPAQNRNFKFFFQFRFRGYGRLRGDLPNAPRPSKRPLSQEG